MKISNAFLTAALIVSAPAFALTPDGNGLYRISNATELEEFAAIVNDGNNTANAVLTADIDMDGVVHTVIGNTKETRYKGTFDGRFHTISCLNMEVDGGTNLALFGYVGAGAKISNMIMDDLCTFFGEDKCAAFVGQCCDSEEGTAEFTCLGNAAAVHAYSADTGKGRASALVGPSDGNVAYKFLNCYNVGEIRGVTVGGMSCHAPKAYLASCFTVTNVKKQANADAKPGNPGKVGTVLVAGVEDPMQTWGYNFFFGGSTSNPTVFYPEITGSNVKWTDYTKPSAENNFGAYKVFEEWWGSTGALCWFLNNCSTENAVWGQNLDEGDAYPSFLPGKKVVNQVTAITNKGEGEYANTTSVIPELPALPEVGSGVTEIATPENQEDVIYTIQGVKVNEVNVPGLYIINGKKVIIK